MRDGERKKNSLLISCCFPVEPTEKLLPILAGEVAWHGGGLSVFCCNVGFTSSVSRRSAVLLLHLAYGKNMMLSDAK